MNSKADRKNTSLSGILTGLVISAVIAILGSIIGTYMIHKEVIPIQSIGLFSYVMLFAGSLTGNVVSTKIQKDKKLIFSFAYSGILSLITIICAMLFFEGLSISALWKIILILISGLLSAAFSAFPTRKNRFKKMRLR